MIINEAEAKRKLGLPRGQKTVPEGFCDESHESY